MADQAPFTPAAPQLPEGWSANYARWTENSEDGVPLWNVGYLSPEYHLVDLVQTAESNPTWLAQRTEQALAQDAQLRLGGVAVGERSVLDRGQGVRGVHERNRPAVAGEPAHLAGEPVMGVDHVVVAGRLRGLGTQDPGGERTQLGGQFALVEALERADARFAEEWWHWFFFATEHAERVICADPLAWYRPEAARIGQENYDDMVAAITDPDRAAAKRAFDAMMQMGKIDIAAIEAARRG